MNQTSWLLIAACALIVLGGLALAAWGLWGDRARGRKRCGKCWYDLPPEAAEGTRCPECGFVALRDRDCTRGRRKCWAVIAGVLIAILGAAPLIGPERARRAALLFLPTWKVTARHALGPYTVLELEARDALAIPPRMVEVRHNGAVVWRLRSFYPTVGGVSLAPGGQVRHIGIGTDITGDGRPDLLITDPNPGTGQFANQYLFTLAAKDEGPTLLPLAVIPYSGAWQEPPTDAAWTFAAADRTFAYWWTTGAGSPYPTVILAWKGDHYAPDEQAMRKPAPDPTQIAAWAQTDREGIALLGGDWKAPILARALDLIYSGNAAAAWDYLRAVWPPGADPDADGAIKAIRDKLEESPFAADILGMQR